MGSRHRTSSSTTLISDTDDSNERLSLAKQLEHVDNPRELRAFILDLTSLIKTQWLVQELMRYKSALHAPSTDESTDDSDACSEDEVIQKVCEIKERNNRLEKEIIAVTRRRIAIQNDIDLLESAYGMLKLGPMWTQGTGFPTDG
ncbi:hypothetical protein H4R34_002258 [Dimargaris verticillata]|uniref:Uncharacterized protein n=1 Tax=Dimargaris verticillata TaxID=2761393 RepID=A0A9W8B9U2_9FUNG|nr:hypothetical protein H4R34_002258 [Dimargaris verticillata]